MAAQHIQAMPTSAFLQSLPLSRAPTTVSKTPLTSSRPAYRQSRARTRRAIVRAERRETPSSTDEHAESLISGSWRTAADTSPSEETLASFCKHASGEWRGYEGEFSATGERVAIPDYYVPDEFREWGLVPNGFECHLSVLANASSLRLKHLRVLPAVSLFGDHVDVEDDVRELPLAPSSAADAATQAHAVTVFPDGCWAAGASALTEKVTALDKYATLESCVRIGHKATRIRVRFDWPRAEMVQAVHAVVEELVGEFSDAAEMDGGSGFVQGWVDGKLPEQEGTRDDRAVVRLPHGIEVGVSVGKQDDEVGDGKFCVWVAWRLDGRLVKVTRAFDDDGRVAFTERVATVEEMSE